MPTIKYKREYQIRPSIEAEVPHLGTSGVILRKTNKNPGIKVKERILISF